MLLIELALAGAGVWFLATARIRVAGRILGRPHTVFIGLILLLQLPTAVLLGSAVGAAEAVKAAEVGATYDAKKVQKKYAWLDPAFLAVVVVAAGAVAAAGARPDVVYYAPPDHAVGVRDFAAEQSARRAAEEREAEVWRGAPADSLIPLDRVRSAGDDDEAADRARSAKGRAARRI